MVVHKSPFSPPRASHKFVAVAVFLILATGIILALPYVSVSLGGVSRLPHAKAYYDEILKKISNATSDTLIEIPTDYEQSPKLMYEQYQGCIRAGFSRTYVANRPYKDIVVDYQKVFSEVSWIQPDQEGYTGYSTKTAAIQIHVVDQSSLDYPLTKEMYQTVYQISFQYADPSLSSCYG